MACAETHSGLMAMNGFETGPWREARERGLPGSGVGGSGVGGGGGALLSY